MKKETQDAIIARNSLIRQYMIENPKYLSGSYHEVMEKFPGTTYEAVRHMARHLRSTLNTPDLPKEEFKITEEVFKRKENAEIKGLKKKLESVIYEYEQLSDMYDSVLGMKSGAIHTDIPVINPDIKIKSEAAAIIQISDGHFGKLVLPSTVNGLNEYNPEIARLRMRKCAENTVKLLHKENAQVDINNLVLILGGDFIENSQLHAHSEMATTLSPMEEVLFARELLVEYITSVTANFKFKNVVIPCVRGNHCVSADTEILTETGWVLSSGLDINQKIAAFNKNTGQIEYVKVDQYSKFFQKNGYVFKSSRKNEIVTHGHNMVVDGEFHKAEDLYNNNTRLLDESFRHSGTLENKEFTKYSDFDLEFLSWIITDGTIVRKSKYNKKDTSGLSYRIQFKLSKPRKIKALMELLDANKIPYTYAEATKEGINKLQPYYIRLYGDIARKYCHEILNGTKEFPSDFIKLSKRQIQKVIDVIEITDGTPRTRTVEWSSICKNNVDIIQTACILNEIECRYTKRGGSSGSLNKSVLKDKYTVHIYRQGMILKNKYIHIDKIEENLEYVQIANRLGTLITRREGVVNFTGNSRITKKMNASVDFKMNYETILYSILKEDFKDPMYQWYIPDSGVAEIEVFGRLVRVLHGQQISYNGGLGGLTIPLNKYIMRMDQINKADYNFLHHFHTLSYPVKNCTVNGSIVGMDPYAYNLGLSFENPQQSFQLLDKERGMTIKAPIFCD